MSAVTIFSIVIFILFNFQFLFSDLLVTIFIFADIHVFTLRFCDQWNLFSDASSTTAYSVTIGCLLRPEWLELSREQLMPFHQVSSFNLIILFIAAQIFEEFSSSFKQTAGLYYWKISHTLSHSIGRKWSSHEFTY